MSKVEEIIDLMLSKQGIVNKIGQEAYDEAEEAINQLLIEARIEDLEPFTDNRITMASSLRRYADKQIAELQQSIKDKDE